MQIVDAHSNGSCKQRSQRRILVVEDSVDVARMMESLLTSYGHEVRTATSGAEALRVVDEFDADVFLVDITLPDSDGRELVGQLKQVAKASSPRFYAVTGYMADEVLKPSLNAGFHGFFVKPIDLNNLNETITNSCN